MPTHSTALDNVRVEVAFSSDPNTATPAFVDLTSRARLDRGIDIERGRTSEFDTVQAGRCVLTLDNTDGALTPGLASSPYFPNVKPQNRVRITYRDSAVAGNLLPAEAASFEGGALGGWVVAGAGSVANSAVRAQHGTRSMLVTYVAALGGAQVTYYGLVIGRTYIASAYVWNPTGCPSVGLTVAGGTSTRTNTNDTWQRISRSFTATSSTATLVLGVLSTGGANNFWADSIMLDEGSSLATFTTTASPIVYRFDGYVDEWPLEWPGGGESEATAPVTALDLQSRLGRMRSFGSVIAETYALDAPLWHFPLSEPGDSTSVGDIRGTGRTLTPLLLGDLGGELTFASGTGPATDGSGAPQFAPFDSSNGYVLVGEVEPRNGLASGQTLEASFLSSTLAAQTVAQWSDPYGSLIRLSLDATGHAVASFVDPWNTSSNRTVTSSQVFADGRTHVGKVTLQLTAGTYTLRLLVDGVERGTAGTWTTTATLTYAFTELRVGGGEYPRNLFTGTIAHVAGYGTALDAAAGLEHYTANTTGFSGETSDERIERVWSWLGLPADLLDLDAGAATIGHIDSTDRGAWQYLQDVATTEGGILFVSTDGLLTMHNRGRSYDASATVDLTVDAAVVDPSTRLMHSLADVVNDMTVTRAGGAEARVVDEASVAEYGYIDGSLTVYSDTDEDAFDRATWALATRSQPRTRLPELALDALSEPGTAATVRTLDIGARVQVTGMPAQGESTFDLLVQGYSERIGAGGWSLTANTTPYLAVRPLILDDPEYGLLDSDNHLVY
jgi:hypothetical protein